MITETDPKTEKLLGDYTELLFGIRRSVRYHTRRSRFFDLFHSITNAIGVIGGSSAIVTVLSGGGSSWTVLAAAIVTTSSAIDLVVGTATMARLHSDLAKQFIELEKDLILAGDATDYTIRKFTARRLMIEAQEPPVLRSLDRLCHNELLRAMGYPNSDQVKIPLHHRALAHFISFDPK